MTILSSLLLDVSTGLAVALFVVLPVLGLVIGGAAAYVILQKIAKKKSEQKLDETSQQVEKMLASAKAECKQLKKEAVLEAKEQELKRRNEFEQEMKEKRAEQQRIEARLNKQEDALERKDAELSKKNESLDAAEGKSESPPRRGVQKQEVLSHQHELMVQELERVAQLTKEEAKKLLTDEILDETRRDVAVQVRNLEQQAKDEADLNAKNIITLAIQRCAADHASEATVSVVPLPNDDMKARIIGREGATSAPSRTRRASNSSSTIRPKSSSFRASIPSDARSRASRSSASSRTAASTPPASRRRWKRSPRNSISRSRRRARTPCSKWASSGCIPSSSNSSAA